MKNILFLVILFSFQVFSQGYPLPEHLRKPYKPTRISKAIKKLEASRAGVDAKKLYFLLDDIQEQTRFFGPSDDHISIKQIGSLVCEQKFEYSKESYNCHLNKKSNNQETYNYLSQHSQRQSSFRKVRLPGNTVHCKLSVSYTGKSFSCYLGGKKVEIRRAI